MNMAQLLLSSSLAVLALGTGVAHAQPSFAGPVAGYLYHSDSRTIRPLQGVPGSTSLGPPLAAGIDRASLAPAGGWAFVTKAGSAGFLRGLAGQSPVEIPVDGLLEQAGRIEWSADASAAVLYSAASGRMQRARLSSAGVRVDAPESISVAGRIAALAVSRTGRIAFSVVASDASGLYLWLPGQVPVRLSEGT